MSINIVINVENVTKTYRLYDSHADRIKETFHPFRKKYHQPFNALNDISFGAEKGQVIGIIGRNGSGKSTLLQIICGIIQPTSGKVAVNGRVSALLELGTGFNPEFTGIENVYLSGSIIGHSKREMDEKIHDILAFADIGDYVHQPVKTYSSGMYVRLAFSVLINLDPDILAVDEFLSVGDISFVNKCMVRIKEIHDRGGTILFVSHSLSTVQMICDKVIWLDNGKIVAMGDPIEVCQNYYAFMIGSNLQNQAEKDLIPQQDTGMAEFIEFELDYWSEKKVLVFDVGQDVPFKFSLLAHQDLERTIFAFSIYRADGDWMLGQTSKEAGVLWPTIAKGQIHKGLFVLNRNCLAPGDYHAACAAYSEDLSICYALTEITVSFSVRSDFPTWGKFCHPCKWMNRNDNENVE